MGKIYLKSQLNYMSFFMLVIIIMYTLLQFARANNTGAANMTASEVYSALECENYEEMLERIGVKEEEIYALREFEGYEGTGVKDNRTGSIIINRDAIHWYLEKIKENTLFSSNRDSDIVILDSFEEALAFQVDLPKKLDESIRKYERFRTRYGSTDTAKREMYESMAEMLKKVDTSFKLCNTVGLPDFLKNLENISLILIMSVLTSSVFLSSFLHSGLSKQLLSSPVSIRKEMLKTFVFASLLSAGTAFLVTGITIFVWSGYLLQEKMLSIPIQAVKGYSDITYPLSVRGYSGLIIVVAAVCAVTAGALFQLISWTSKNVLVAVILSLLCCFVISYFHKDILDWATRDNVYLIIHDRPVRKLALLFATSALLWTAAMAVIVFLSRGRIRNIKTR